MCVDTLFSLPIFYNWDPFCKLFRHRPINRVKMHSSCIFFNYKLYMSRKHALKKLYYLSVHIFVIMVDYALMWTHKHLGTKKTSDLCIFIVTHRVEEVMCHIKLNCRCR